jgi:hypothetical protein
MAIQGGARRGIRGLVVGRPGTLMLPLDESFTGYLQDRPNRAPAWILVMVNVSKLLGLEFHGAILAELVDRPLCTGPSKMT